MNHNCPYADDATVAAQVVREIDSAAEQDRPLAQIRVTTDAIPGSISTAPVTPERGRVLGKLRAVPVDGGAAVEGDPSNERLLEILIHPDDWNLVLVEAPLGALGCDPEAKVRTLYGLPVDESAKGASR